MDDNAVILFLNLKKTENHNKNMSKSEEEIITLNPNEDHEQDWTPSNHFQDIADFVAGMVFSSKLSDVTIYCENGKVKSHKLVLGMSSFLKELFLEEDQVDVLLPDVPVEDVKGLLSLIYTGCANIVHE